MWKKIFWLLLIATLVAGPACAKEPPENEFTLGEEFSLAIGDTATIAREELQVTFSNVVSDNRCPTAAECIVAGEAVCLLEVMHGGSREPLILTQPGLSGPETSDLLEYEVTFDLEPYPEAGEEIAAADYRLHLVVTQAPA